jgi:hypothetical protein
MTLSRLRLARAGCAALGALWLAWATPSAADTDTVVRSRMPDGSTAYSDAPATGAASTRTLEVEPHTADPEAAARANRELELSRQRMAAEIAAHEARRVELDQSVRVAADRLRQAQARRDEGRVIGEGDRQGRRFTADYWARQTALDAQVRAESAEVARLRRERAALQH